MDQLSRDARAARKLGLSYGKYIALNKPPKPPAERYPQKTEQSDQEPHCAYCGKIIPKNCKSRKYCCPDCADKARQQQKTDSAKKVNQLKPPKEKPPIFCIRCGKQIPEHEHRRKYCSGACADEALEEQQKKYKRASRAKK